MAFTNIKTEIRSSYQFYQFTFKYFKVKTNTIPFDFLVFLVNFGFRQFQLILISVNGIISVNNHKYFRLILIFDNCNNIDWKLNFILKFVRI